MQLIEANERVAALQAESVPQVVDKETAMETEEEPKHKPFRELDDRELIDLEEVQEGIQ